MTNGPGSSSIASLSAGAVCTISSHRSYCWSPSEPAALLAHPAVSSQPDEAWLAGHFSLYKPTDNRTPFRDIRKLLPGECLICTPDDRHPEPGVV